MGDILSKRNQSEGAKELLLADYKYLTDSFWKNEEVGEKRVTFFITLVTAVLTALTALSPKDFSKTSSFSYPAPFQSDIFFLIMIFTLFALLVIGMVTLFRILKRNKVTDGYKRDMDRIRQLFKQFYDESEVLKNYQPFRPPEAPQLRKREFGGLAYTVAVINSLIFTVLVVVVQLKYLYLIPEKAPQKLVPDCIAALIAAGILALTFAYFLNVRLIKWRDS